MLSVSHSLNSIRRISRDIIVTDVQAATNLGKLQEIRRSVLHSLDRVKYDLDSTTLISNSLHKFVGLSTLLCDIINDVKFIPVNNSLGKNIFKPVLKSNGKPLEDVISQIRMGNLDELLNIYKNVSNDIINVHFNNDQIKNTFKRFMETSFSDRKLHKIIHENATFVREKLSKNLYEKNINFDTQYGGLDVLYHIDKSLKNLR